MKKNIFFTLLVIFSFFIFKNLNAIENKILFKVDNHVITSLDIKNEVNYLKTTNEKISLLNKSEIFEIAKNSLIKEKLKEIKILTFVKKIKVEEIYLENLIMNIVNNNNLESKEKLKTHLIKNNIKYEYMIKKLSISALWNRFIYDNFFSKIKIDEALIKEQVKSQKDLITQFNLSEIVFDISEGENLNDKFALIRNSIENSGFESAALNYSISASANQGGQIGWISENSLNRKLSSEINKLKLGEFTNPIVIPGGFIIIKLDEIKIHLKQRK